MGNGYDGKRIDIMLFEGAQKLPMSTFDDEAAYYVATLWTNILMKVKGEELMRYEKELWKMGFDVHGRDAVCPTLDCYRYNCGDGERLSWSLTKKGAFWFPRHRSGYRQLWQAISCGQMDFSQLADKARLGKFDELEQLSEDISSLYIQVLDGKDVAFPQLPNRHLGAGFAQRWVSKIAKMSNMDLMLESYFSGVPAEYISAGVA